MPLKKFVPIPKADIDCAAGFTSELLPCPFCGGKAITCGGVNERTSIVVYKVICTKCESVQVHSNGKGEPKYIRNKVIEIWNTRK